MNLYIEKTNKFYELFDPKTGFYFRSGVMSDGKDTGVDPFQREFPNLIDIGIMERCVCANQCKVDCYQRAIDRKGQNMSVENYRKIMEECRGKVFQVALGGAGDPDTHENIEEILKISRENQVVPNFTTSGIAFDERKAELCKEYCGAIAVSDHFADYTDRTLDMLIDKGIKTNIHYVLSKNSIDTAIDRLKNGGFHKGINAVVFLLYKPVGLGKTSNVLHYDDPKVKEFFELIDTNAFDFSIGFDSCTSPAIVNLTRNINENSIDYCEGARFSMYIDAQMNAMPCSFANQDSRWFVSLNDHTIQEAWNSDVFESFRNCLKNSCVGCKDRLSCGGGCPLCPDVVLCNREEKHKIINFASI